MDTLCISPRGDRVEEGHSDRERERESDMGGGLMGEMEGGGGTKERREKGVKGRDTVRPNFCIAQGSAFIHNLFVWNAVLRVTFFTAVATLSLIP